MTKKDVEEFNKKLKAERDKPKDKHETQESTNVDSASQILQIATLIQIQTLSI